MDKQSFQNMCKVWWRLASEKNCQYEKTVRANRVLQIKEPHLDIV